MPKLLLFAFLPATLALPLWAAGGTSPRAASRRLLVLVLAFEAVYHALLAAGPVR